MIDILFVIDNAYREYFGIYLLQKYLEDLGVTSQITNRFVFRSAFNKYQPKAVVLPNCINELIPKIQERSFVFVLSSESGNGQIPLIQQLVNGDSDFPTYLENIDLLFSWGNRMTTAFVNSGRLSADHIATFGNPSTDHWLMPKCGSGKKTIGFTTSLRILTNFKDPIHWLYEADKVAEGAYFTSPRHSESWLYYEASLVRALSQLIIDGVRPTKRHMSLRVHPMENLGAYDFLKQKCGPQFSLNKGGPITEWLNSISVLFSFMSGSMLDAYMAGVPVVSIKNLIDPLALSAIPECFLYDYDGYFPHINDLKEVGEISEKEILEKTKRSELDQFLSDAFTADRKRPASLSIAEKMREFLKENKTRPWRALEIPRVPRVLQSSPLLDLGVRYLLSKKQKLVHPLRLSHLPGAKLSHRSSVRSAESIYRQNPTDVKA